MKKVIVILLMFLIVPALTSCRNGLDKLSNVEVGEYQVYRKDLGLCEMVFVDVEFMYNDVSYVIAGGGCSVESQYFIRYNNEFISLQEAYNEDIVSGEELYSSELAVYEEETF
jgi:hypothetical protein